MKRQKIIVIGAGPGGLATSMLLAAQGLEVEVFESRDQVGGRTSILEREGFKFDRGPTFFLYPEILERIFEACGASLHDEVELIRLDPNYRLLFESGEEINATSDIDRMREEIARLNPDDAKALDRYVADNTKKLETFKPFLEQPFNSHLDALKLPLFRVMPQLRPWTSVDGDLKRYFSDKRVRLGFSFQSKYLGMSPFRCPSLFTILAFLEYQYGVFHPKGGCGAVSEAMARVARRMGVKIHLSEPVREVLLEGRRAVGIRTDTGKHHADRLVINADFAHAMKNLVSNGARRKWSDQKLKKKKYSCSTFMLYLGIEGEVPHVAHHNVFLAEGYEDHLKDIETRYQLTENPSFYVQNPCVTDPSMAPPGCSSLYVLVPVPHLHDNIDWPTVRQSFRDSTVARIEKHLGIENLNERIKVEEICTPEDWGASFQLYRGATFSLAHSINQMLSFRPRNRFDDIEGVYLTGGGTHPGSGLPVIFQSAEIASRLIAEDLGTHTPDTTIHAGPQRKAS